MPHERKSKAPYHGSGRVSELYPVLDSRIKDEKVSDMKTIGVGFSPIEAMEFGARLFLAGLKELDTSNNDIRMTGHRYKGNHVSIISVPPKKKKK